MQGEDISAGAVREVKEETGVRIDYFILSGCIYNFQVC